MLRQVTILLESTNGKTPHYTWGYNLYSCLLQKLDKSFAESLHTNGLKPVNQYLEIVKNTKMAVWTINILGEKASEQILPILLKEKTYLIENYKTQLSVIKCEEVKSFTEKEFVEKHLIIEPYNPRIDILHTTPCSFKSNEEYMIFPSVQLIIKSAVQKWNSYSKEYSIDDELAIEQLIENTKIQNYYLRSAQYNIKGISIPSFVGNTTLSIKGPEPMLRLFNLLMKFLEFSGLGMKTSLGMGGCKIK